MDIQSLRNNLLHIAEEEGSISYILANTPLALDATDPDVIEVGNFFLPRSTGFEMEFDNDGELTKSMFDGVNLLDLDINNAEQRFRIPSGIEGLKALYQISMILKQNALFSDYSGIHYHIDCTDFFSKITRYYISLEQEWLLKELDSWDYKGKYNSRGISYNTLFTKHIKDYEVSILSGSWIRFKDYLKTMEFRIGNMTFEYKTLFERITHANHIVEKFKYNVLINDIKTNTPILLYEDEDNLREFLKNRNKQI
jgi:hypothetical protein